MFSVLRAVRPVFRISWAVPRSMSTRVPAWRDDHRRRLTALVAHRDRETLTEAEMLERNPRSPVVEVSRACPSPHTRPRRRSGAPRPMARAIDGLAPGLPGRCASRPGVYSGRADQHDEEHRGTGPDGSPRGA